MRQTSCLAYAQCLKSLDKIGLGPVETLSDIDAILYVGERAQPLHDVSVFVFDGYSTRLKGAIAFMFGAPDSPLGKVRCPA
jgi:hypothetical protein